MCVERFVVRKDIFFRKQTIVLSALIFITLFDGGEFD